MPRSIHRNSIKAHVYNAIKSGGRAEQVLKLYASHGAMTDREVCARLGYSDMNSVRPAITGLVKNGFLVEDGDTVCEVTQMTVRRCKVADGVLD